MSLSHSPSIVTDGLVMYYDMHNTQKSWKGKPTTNTIPSAATMTSWVPYYRTISAVAFTTEMGTTGYRMLNQPSWNGVYRGVTIPSAGTYTFSAWVRYLGGSSANNGGTVYISGWGGGDSAVTLDKSKVGVWQRISITLNCTNTSMTFYLISYGGTDNGTTSPDYSSWEVTMPQVEAGSVATPFVDSIRFANNNLEASPSFPTWNINAGSSASGGTLTFANGSYNNKGTWDLYKTYSGLTTGVNYTWSALVKLGTASNFIVTMNNTLSWNTGPAINFTGLSNLEWTRVSITGTTSSGSFNLHLGASLNDLMAAVVQTGGTVFIKDVRLELTGSQSSLVDLAGQNTINANSLAYAGDGTFSFNGSDNYITAPLSIGSDPVVTINQWIKRTADFTNGGYWGLGGGVSNNGINGYTSVTNKIGWDLWGQTTFHTGQDYPLNQWVNVCWVKNTTSFTTSTLKVYINGVEFPLTTTVRNNSSTVNITSGLAVGRITDTVNSYHAPGQVSVTSVYNRALSAAEVQQNFQALRGRYGI